MKLAIRICACAVVSVAYLIPTWARADSITPECSQDNGNNDTESCINSIFAKFGFYDSPASLVVKAGSGQFAFSATSVEDAITKWNTEFPPNQQLTADQQITGKYFVNIFGSKGTSDLNLSPQLFANFPLLNTVPTSAALTFDGITIEANFLANSTTINFEIVGPNITKSFAAPTRYDALQDLGAWIRQNANMLLNAIHNAMASHTATDPIVGNPQSLMQSFATFDYFMGTDLGETTPQGPSEKLNPLFAMSMEPQYFSANNVSGEAIRVPLDYTWFFPDPRMSVTIDLPLSFIREGSVNSFTGSLGAGLRIPITDHWYVTPQLRIGVDGTLDTQYVGDYGSMLYSPGIRSKYNIFLDDNTTLSVVNEANYYHSIDIRLGAYTLNPDISSTIYSNGLTAETSADYQLFANPTTWQAYFVDHRIAGTHSQMDSWDEIGLSLGTRQGIATQSWENLRFGASFGFGEAGYNAYELNFTVRF